MRSTPLSSPVYAPRPAPPSFLFNAALPKISEVAEVVQKARAASAPGPSGVPYRLYKHCPSILAFGLEEPGHPLRVAESSNSSYLKGFIKSLISLNYAALLGDLKIEPLVSLSEP